ncbi:MAG: PHB depolymerase family esterase [Candidatus Riflebacteria bacterium]|nr:PHB depolymerase family esterase [Candidatus Riflebacteria bacterium]
MQLALNDIFLDLFDNHPKFQASGSLTEVIDLERNPGKLRMYKYVPTPAPTSEAPLVVVLHGCMQSAQEIANSGGWNQLADRFGFYVLYPEQQLKNNSIGAFHWFKDEHIRAGKGECGSIKEMVDRMKVDYRIDSRKVFVTGLSAGGCFTTVMCCAYPELFASGAVMSGIAYRAADSNHALKVMFQGKSRKPEEWARLVSETHPGYSGSYPKMLVFHGTRDIMVNPNNMQSIVAQFTALHQTSQTPDIVDTVNGFPHKIYHDKNGRPVVETFEITGMAHGIAINPGTGVDQGGHQDNFAFPVGIFSSFFALQSWGIIPPCQKSQVL